MQVDWLTVTAQWVNFLILVVLLKRFLYGPIVRAMDRRQQTIEARIADARQKVAQAEQAAAHYQEKARALDEQKTALLAEARAVAAQERAGLVEHARREVESMTQRWRREVEREKAAFQDQLRRELGRLVIATARKALRDLASLELERALTAHFIERLQGLPEEEKHRLSDFGSVTVASSADLVADEREFLVDALTQSLGSGLTVNFEPLPDSALGLMLITPAYTLEWHLEHYFEDLGAVLEAALTGAGQEGSGSRVE